MKKYIFTPIILFSIAFTGCSFIPEAANVSPDMEAGMEQVEALPTVDPQAIEDFLAAGGSSYLDASGVYSFLYPNDFIQSEEGENIIRIYKRGDQERPQSEITDGAVVIFELVDLEGHTLESLVDERIGQSVEDGMVEVTQQKTATTFNGYQAYKFKLRGLGEFDHLVVQKEGSDYAVWITYLVEDPNSNGYQAEVDATLSSLQILK